jgi:hypothetical protein
VVLHGCAQPGSSVSVRSITALPGTTVRCYDLNFVVGWLVLSDW